MKSLKLLFIFSLLFFAACDKEDDSLDGGPIDSTIQISAKETSSTGEIILNCKTEKEYECFNNKISTTKRIGQNTIEISFEKITGENKCATATGPATAEINLGALAVGEYHLTLETMDAQN